MGADRLILVAPQCEVNSQARKGAAGAQSKLASHETYPNWTEFYAKEGKGLRIAFTRRGGKKRTVHSLKEAIHSYKEQYLGDFNQPIYLIFGPEDNGLDTSDLEYTNMSCYLPTYGDFPSMNLSHAVMLALFVTQDTLDQSGLRERINPSESSLEPTEPLYFPDERIKEWLTTMGFNINARKASAYITLRRLLLQNMPTDVELQVLEAILQQNIRKLKLTQDRQGDIQEADKDSLD